MCGLYQLSQAPGSAQAPKSFTVRDPEDKLKHSVWQANATSASTRQR